VEEEGDRTGVVFGWTAGEEDLLDDSAVGRFLRETGVRVRSVYDVEKKKERDKFLEAMPQEMVQLERVDEENSLIHGELQGQPRLLLCTIVDANICAIVLR
jgi:hypothetical protein